MGINSGKNVQMCPNFEESEKLLKGNINIEISFINIELKKFDNYYKWVNKIS